MGDIELIVGQQTQAAQLVEGRIQELSDLLTDLSGKIDGSVGSFKGSTANGFAEAIMAWFESTSTIGTQMAEFAAGLYAIDMIFSRTDDAIAQVGDGMSQSLESYEQRLGRLG